MEIFGEPAAEFSKVHWAASVATKNVCVAEEFQDANTELEAMSCYYNWAV